MDADKLHEETHARLRVLQDEITELQARLRVVGDEHDLLIGVAMVFEKPKVGPGTKVWPTIPERGGAF